MTRNGKSVLLVLALFAASPRGAIAVVENEYPLLGDRTETGGRNYAAEYCEARPDDAALPPDPRELISGANLNREDSIVVFNDAFELCQNETLFETQARQNEILESRGEEPIYSAKPRPSTCGEWRAAVERGRDYVLSNAITGPVLTVQSLFNLFDYLGYEVPDGADELNALSAHVSQQRYGWPPSPRDNPFPLPGEDPNLTDGGSGQLPISLVQVKDDEGRWTGRIGVTCFACHIGQIGEGEVVGPNAVDGYPELYGGSPSGLYLGLNGSNTDTGLAYHDLDMANGRYGENSFDVVLSNPGYMVNRTRGTNAADQEIVNVLMGRNLHTMDWRSPLFEPGAAGKLFPTVATAGGDQDMPSWWWSSNKSRYLWVGFGSTGSSRNNFFPASTNPFDGKWSKAREGDFQDLDVWLNSLEAPLYEGPPIDVALAEEGAVLFHEKDLWEDGGNVDIPRPSRGNGSCASCHGAYSPRYVHTKGVLPDPSLAGMSGYTVPLRIVGTDPEQSNLFTQGFEDNRDNTEFIFERTWFAYPDATPGYALPEENTAADDPTSDITRGGFSPGPCGLSTRGGYHAPPLHGVWASGPYFHNGSVPTVWDVLKPSDRPEVWRRQLVPESAATPILGDRGFDTSLVRAYDHGKLGWNYDALQCDAVGQVPYVSCDPEAPTALQVMEDLLPPYLLGPGEDETANRAIYNTNRYSKGNEGHEYTKTLSDAERRALIEYLKTL